MEKRRKNLTIHNLLNGLDNIEYIDGKAITKDQFIMCKEEIIKLKERSRFYVEGLNRIDTFLMSKYLGVPPFICRDLINNL